MTRQSFSACLLTVALASLLLGCAGATASDRDLARQIDAFMREAYQADEPGAAIIVKRDDRTILRAGYGLADLELAVPVEPDMVFRIGSVTKQFTAVAILMLVEDGKLALGDRIEAHLPGYPIHGLTITIEHLLAHTSGIRSYTSLPGFLASQRVDRSVDEMIAVFSEEPMDFVPGYRWQYSNSGYFLLGAIIEAVTGQAWAAFLQERIFTPLGMAGTHADGHDRIIPRRVSGYEPDPDGGGWMNAAYLSMTQPYAAGAMLSTVDDLARWNAALQAGELIAPELLARAWTPVALADGSSSGYGYGWSIGEWRGSRVISHGGGINGFLCEAIHCPDEAVYVAVLTNSSGKAPGPANLARTAAALAMGKPWEPVPINLVPDRLAEYVGVYRIDEQNTRTLAVADGRLYSQRTGGSRQQVEPMAPDAFYFADSFSHFVIERDTSGAIRGMTMHTMGAEPRFAALTDEQPQIRQAVTLDLETLDRYVGRYELTPSFILTVTREGEQLWTQATGQPKLAIRPESTTSFFLVDVDARLEFTVDADGQVTGVTLHQLGRQMPARRLAE